MAKTAAEIEAEIKQGEDLLTRLKTQQTDLRTTPVPAGQTRAEQMLNQNTPPAHVNKLSVSKPFSFHRFLSGMARNEPQNVCSHEHDVVDRYTKAVRSTGCDLMQNRGVGIWLPMNLNEDYGGQLVQSSAAEADIAYVKAVFAETRPSFDPDEATWRFRRKQMSEETYIKSLSAYDWTTGGSVVAPPVQGDIIPLIRPQAAFLAAGAQALTLPPNGRFVRPRITNAPNVRAVGEGQDTPTSDISTGDMELTAKKIAGGVIVNEEATMFTSGTLDAIAQAELGRSLGLKMDAYAFYGIGSTQIPAGLTSATYTGKIINVDTDYPSCKGIGADGNTLRPEYGDYLPALIAERSFNMDGQTGAWVMRPSVYALAAGQRTDAVTTGDQQGVLVDQWRRFNEQVPTGFRSRRVVQSTNIDNTATKNSGTGLSDVFFGVWQYAIMATYGAINFQQGHNGTTFMNGQYIIRGTAFGDVGFMYPPAFLWYPYVMGLTTTGNW